MRVCLVYDCLFPHTIGGAERWYRNLAEALIADGHSVTYLTLRQWSPNAAPQIPGLRVVAVGPPMDLYADGRRRIWPPLRFGAGVLRHLARDGGAYDVVHLASFPFFSLLAAAAVRPVHRYQLLVDWHEFWTLDYWREYLGPVRGRVGWTIQGLCASIPHRAFCFSRRHADRLRAQAPRTEVTMLTGQYVGDQAVAKPEPAHPLVVFIGRHIPEKRATALVPAIAEARRLRPELRAVIFGDGPDRPRIERLVSSLGLTEVVSTPGFVDEATIDAALRRALCLVLPSRREGYGLVVLEAAARGVPTVVVDDPDNAATELVVDDENGVIAQDASPRALAAAILRVHEAGPALRASSTAWFVRNSSLLSLSSSFSRLIAIYAGTQAAGEMEQPKAPIADRSG